MSFQAKNELVRGKQLAVQRLCLPFKITHHATPASVVVNEDDKAILCLKTEGVDHITGALDSTDTAPTYASANDASGVFNILVIIKEKVLKVCSAQVVKRNGQEVISCTLPSAPADGIVAGGALDKIALNADSATDLSAADLDACLIVDYIVHH